MADGRHDRVRAGRLRRSLGPVRMGARTAAARAALAARTIGADRDKKETRTREFHERIAARYVAELGEMKGALMKLGQLLSFVDAGAVPARYREIYSRTFGTLLADAPAMPMEVLDEVVQSEFGAPAKEVFAWFSPQPMAAASIGQVHEARLEDGTRVAVKIQYPGVAGAIDDDLSNAELLATFFRLGQSFMGGLAPRADPRVVVSELRERISEELDYEIEARNQEIFRALYDDHPFIHIPGVFAEFCTSRVLTMELIEGRRWEEALVGPEDLRQRWAEVIYRFVLSSVDRYAIFNADPHPGNYLFHEDGTVTFLDFGCVKFMPPEQMLRNVGIIRAVADSRAGDFRRGLIEGGFLPADDSIEAERLLRWYRSAFGPLLQRPYRFNHEDVAALIRRIYDPRGEWGDIVRRFKAPKDFILTTRIDLGLWSIMASLDAFGDWYAINEEIWGTGPPATELGRLDASWQERMRQRPDWPPARPDRPPRFRLPIASVGFDPLEDDFQADPYPDYERLRSQAPVHWVPPGAYLIPRYEDCLALLRDPRLSADPTRSELYQAVVPSAWGENSAVDRITRRLLLFMDPPDHERLRSLVSSAFTRRAVEDLRPRIQIITHELLDGVISRGQMDLVGDLAYPLPIRVIAELLGVPMEDGERFAGWSRDLVALLSIDTPSREDVEHGNSTVDAFLEYFRDLIEDRRRESRRDLLSALVGAEDGGERLSTDELLATCVLLLIAGHETTANLIGNGTIALMRNRDVWSRLVSDPGFIPNAVEELLRYDSPVQATARTTLESVEVGGKTIGPGQRVVILVGSANRDPSVFDDPDRIVPDRSVSSHLAFGGGIHFCLGAPLARLEAQVVFEALTERLPGLVAASEEVRWKPTFPIRGPESLPVRW